MPSRLFDMTTERKWEAQWARVSGQKELSTDQVDLGYSRMSPAVSGMCKYEAQESGQD